MSQARSGELSVELGHREPNALSAPKERPTLWANEPAWRLASSARPPCVWLAPGPWPLLT